MGGLLAHSRSGACLGVSGITLRSRDKVPIPHRSVSLDPDELVNRSTRRIPTSRRAHTIPLVACASSHLCPILSLCECARMLESLLAVEIHGSFDVPPSETMPEDKGPSTLVDRCGVQCCRSAAHAIKATLQKIGNLPSVPSSVGCGARSTWLYGTAGSQTALLRSQIEPLGGSSRGQPTDDPYPARAWAEILAVALGTTAPILLLAPSTRGAEAGLARPPRCAQTGLLSQKAKVGDMRSRKPFRMDQPPCLPPSNMEMQMEVARVCHRQ